MPRPFLARRTAFAWAPLVSIALAACADPAADPDAIADSSLAGDLALVQRAANPQPIFRDTALTEAPAPRGADARSAGPVARPERPRPAAAAPPRESPEGRRGAPRRPRQVAETPRPPEPQEPAPQAATVPTERAGESAGRSIGAGAVLAATSNARVCTRSNLPGDRITATVSEPVRGTNGAEIPAGAKVVLEVASIEARDPPAEGQVRFRVTSVAIGDESYPASGNATASGPLERAQGARSASSDRKKVIGGAIAGAVLGQMMGKDTRSTIIGAAAGAAAGTAAAKMGDQGESCLTPGVPVRITLEEAVVLR